MFNSLSTTYMECILIWLFDSEDFLVKFNIIPL